MSEVRTFFRYCPSCGKRFHIKLVERKLVDEKRETETIKKEVPIVSPGRVSGGIRYGFAGTGFGGPLVLEQDVPVTVDVEEFQYSYKCKHCGHVWSEVKTEDVREDKTP